MVGLCVASSFDLLDQILPPLYSLFRSQDRGNSMTTGSSSLSWHMHFRWTWRWNAGKMGCIEGYSFPAYFSFIDCTKRKCHECSIHTRFIWVTIHFQIQTDWIYNSDFFREESEINAYYWQEESLKPITHSQMEHTEGPSFRPEGGGPRSSGEFL